MQGVEAFPLLHGFALSETANERAVFMRVYLDLLAEGARRRVQAPQGWASTLQICLNRAGAKEREIYLNHLAAVYVAASPAPRAERRDVAARDVESLISRGEREDVIALAAVSGVRLTPEQIETLARRAAREGDAGLAEALLSREPVSMATAPLFLEADPKQRAAILLAARRAELGRRPLKSARRFDAETASRLEHSAIAGERDEFANALAFALGVDPDLAGRIAADPFGEPLALALAALGAPRDLAVRVVTARDMMDGDTFPRLHALASIVDRVTATTARRILAALSEPEAAGEPAPPAAAPRAAAHPSPFLRREAAPAAKAAASLETSARPALNSRRP